MNEAHFVVVGGSKGIGLGIVQRLSQAGHHVTVLSRSAGESLGQLAGVTHHAVDVTTDEVTTEMFPEQIAGVAYCPGSLNLKSFRATKPEVFRDDFEVNVVGCVKVLQAALAPLKRADQASIVTFSTVAVAKGLPSHASIAASKGAIEGITRSLAAELSPKIRVNCIAPALTDTPLASRFFGSEDKVAAMAEKYPLRRTGTVDDIASMAAFLLSDQSTWITGQIIGVDGGMSSVG